MSEEQSAVSQSSDDAAGFPSPPKPPASIQDLPEDQRHELIEYFREIIHVEQTTGHMPPPSMLKWTNSFNTVSIEELLK